MKKILLLSLFIVTTVSRISFAQCNTEQLCNDCIPKLSSGFNFLKTYKVQGGAEKVEYSYVFTKGTQYMITVCEPSVNTNSTIVVTLFDAQRNKVASNKVNGSLIPAIAYPCNATGIYYLQYTFEDASIRCAGSALGFKK